MKKLMLTLWLGLASVLTASENRSPTDSSILAVAQAALPGFLEKIPAGHEARYGFRDASEFGRAKLGTPIPVYGTSASLADTAAGISDSSWNRPIALKVWRVPVKIGPQARSLITVEDVHGQLEAVGFGGSQLAVEMDAMPLPHPGMRKSLLRVDALRCDYLVLDDSGKGIDEGEYHPLRSAREAFPGDSSSVRSRKELFGSLHNHLHRRGRGPRHP